MEHGVLINATLFEIDGRLPVVNFFFWGGQHRFAMPPISLLAGRLAKESCASAQAYRTVKDVSPRNSKTMIEDILCRYKDSTLIAIHKPTGKWCSLEIDSEHSAKLCPGQHFQKFPFSADSDVFNAVVDALDLNQGEQFSDGRSFEYLLLKCSSACNYHCTYCYDHDEVEKSKNLDLHATCSAVKQAIDLSRTHLTLLFHGGEPLIRFRFVHDVSIFASSYAASAGKKIFFKLQTHGGMFDDAIVDFLTRYDFFVGISLDGPREVNDKFRVLKNGQGTYAKFEAAYHRYPEFMRERCGIITTPTTVSAQHLLRVARHFRDMGFRAWRTTNYLAIGRVQDDWSYETDSDTYVNAVLGLVDAIEAGEFDGFYIGPVMSLLTNLLSDERPDMCTPGNNSCGAGRRFLSIEADGTILPCDTLNRNDFSVGHISLDSLKDALRHPNAEQISASLPRRGCHFCALLGICGGTCLGLSSLSRVRPMLCEAYQRLYPELMDRLLRSSKLADYFDECCAIEDAKLEAVV